MRPLPAPTTAPTYRRARAVPLALAATLVLASCGGSGGDGGQAEGPIEGITVEGEFGEEPTVEVERPFELEETQSRVLIDGEGEELEAGDQVSVDFFVTDGTTGENEQSSYETEPVALALEEGTANPDLLEVLLEASVNDRLLVALAPEEPLEGQTAAPTGTDTVVFVLDILEVLPEPLAQAEGTEVDPEEGAPTVETDADGAVTGVTPPEGGTAPTELEVYTLIEGEGAPVEADDVLTVHYTGVLYSDGTVFDSSWERGEPAEFPLTSVIAGWQQGLAGVPVGSRVVLVVPPDLGYGAEGSPPSIPADATLVFVVDVLAAR